MVNKHHNFCFFNLYGTYYKDQTKYYPDKIWVPEARRCVYEWQKPCALAAVNSATLASVDGKWDGNPFYMDIASVAEVPSE